MAKHRICTSVRAAFAGLLILNLIAACAAGCVVPVSEQTPSTIPNPFITDRVVTVHIVMSEEDWTYCQRNALAEQYVKADFWFDGELIPDVGVRPKGNSSLWQAANARSPRFSLKVDFNLFNRAREFRGLKKLNFNNGWSDPTLIRERLAYELFEQMGVPTPRTSFVDLWINDTHLGIYTQVEQVDRTFLQRHFPKDDGNLYKPETFVSPLNWTETDLEEQQAKMATSQQDTESGLDVNLGGGKLIDIINALEQGGMGDDNATPEPPIPPRGAPRPAGAPGQPRDFLELMGLKTNENNPDHSALLHFLDVLNNEPEETFPAEIEKVLDVDQVLRFLAVSTLIVHLDNYLGSGHNYYLYEVDGRFTIIPWDLNMAFGTFNCGCSRERLINFYIDEPTGGPVASRPLVERLLSHQPYLDTYHGYLTSLLIGPFAISEMESRIDQLASQIRPYIKADGLNFFSPEDFERGLVADVGRGISRQGGQPQGSPRALGLKTFVVERSASVRQQLAGELPSGPGDGSGNEATSGMCAGNRQPVEQPPRR